MRLIDLSHEISDGVITYPGLPGPKVSDHMSFDDSAGHYAEGVEFEIKRIEMVANTGTYLDTPAHRHRDGFDLSALALDKVAFVPGVCVDDTGEVPESVGGRAVLYRTGWDRHWGTARYGEGGHPHLTAETVDRLVAAGPAIVGIDSVNIDDTATGERPAHTGLLAAGIPVVEHLTGLDHLPTEGFRFFAVPVRFAGVATFPVRAFALIE